MPEDLERGPLFLDQVVGGAVGELTLYSCCCYTVTLPGPSPLSSKAHTLD